MAGPLHLRDLKPKYRGVLFRSEQRRLNWNGVSDFGRPDLSLSCSPATPFSRNRWLQRRTVAGFSPKYLPISEQVQPAAINNAICKRWWKREYSSWVISWCISFRHMVEISVCGLFKLPPLILQRIIRPDRKSPAQWQKERHQFSETRQNPVENGTRKPSSSNAHGITKVS